MSSDTTEKTVDMVKEPYTFRRSEPLCSLDRGYDIEGELECAGCLYCNERHPRDPPAMCQIWDHPVSLSCGHVLYHDGLVYQEKARMLTVKCPQCGEPYTADLPSYKLRKLDMALNKAISLAVSGKAYELRHTRDFLNQVWKSSYIFYSNDFDDKSSPEDVAPDDLFSRPLLLLEVIIRCVWSFGGYNQLFAWDRVQHENKNLTLDHAQHEDSSKDVDWRVDDFLPTDKNLPTDEDLPTDGDLPKDGGFAGMLAKLAGVWGVFTAM